MTRRVTGKEQTHTGYTARHERQLRRHARPASPIENVNTVAASGSGTVTIGDPTIYGMNHITLTGNPTLAFPTPAAGAGFMFKLIEDATGGHTVTWPSSSVRRFVGGTTPALSTAAGAINLFNAVCDDGVKWDVVYIGPMS